VLPGQRRITMESIQILNYFKENGGNKSHQNLWDTDKAMLRGQFIALKTYITKQEKFKTVTKVSTLGS
jgi:hypothetical protein